MIEIVAVTGVIVVVFGFAVFVGLAPEREPQIARGQEERPDLVPSRFFAEPGAPEIVVELDPRADDALLRRVERHIRQEQAAVEDFLLVPSGESLRRRSSSPLVN